MDTVTTLSIGAIARATGVPIDTIRYYERQGLLPPPARRPSGYRSYDGTVIPRLRFIRQAKSLGFTLEEIGDLLSLSADRAQGVAGVKQRAQQRLAAIDQRMAELRRVREGLHQLIEACPGHGRPEDCPILAALAQPEQPA